jgi:hypothetical protein
MWTDDEFDDDDDDDISGVGIRLSAERNAGRR